MLPSGPMATFAGTVRPPKLLLGSVSERPLPGSGARAREPLTGALSTSVSSASRQPTRAFRSNEVGSWGGRGIGGRRSGAFIDHASRIEAVLHLDRVPRR